jgi:hypothetical protein
MASCTIRKVRLTTTAERTSSLTHACNVHRSFISEIKMEDEVLKGFIKPGIPLHPLEMKYFIYVNV